MINDLAVWNPEDMNTTFAEAYNSGEIDNLLQLYEPTALHATKEENLTIGIDNIKEDLQGLLKVGGHMDSINLSTIIHDDIALLQAHFTLKTVGDEKIIIEG